MTALTDNSVDLFGKTVNDLQSGASVVGGKAKGTLNYIEDYTSAGFDMTKGNHFVVLKAESDTATSITATMEDRTVTLDSDGILVFQMTKAKKSLPLVFTASDGETTKSKSINLKDLILATE